jgi:hypothetical protein
VHVLMGIEPVPPLWVTNYRYLWDMTARLVCKEQKPVSHWKLVHRMFTNELEQGEGETAMQRRASVMSAEEQTHDNCWHYLANMAAEVYDLQPRFWPITPPIDQSIFELCDIMDKTGHNLHTLLDRKKQAGGWVLCSERDLGISYGFLELLLLIARFIPTLRDILGKKSHRVHSQVTKAKVDMLQQKTKESYDIVMAKAQADIAHLKKTGFKTICGNVRQGITGEKLAAFLFDRDLETYAKEYVESAIEAYSGILKVKLN